MVYRPLPAHLHIAQRSFLRPAIRGESRRNEGKFLDAAAGEAGGENWTKSTFFKEVCAQLGIPNACLLHSILNQMAKLKE